MDAARIVALASQLAAADRAACDRVGLGELTRTVSQLRAWCDALDVRIARRADELAAEGRSEPAAGVLANNGRRAGGEARAAARRGETCERHPGFGEALADGEISAGHVDVLGRARAGLDPAAQNSFDARTDQLLDDARRQRVDEFARRCASAARQACADAGVAR